VGAISSLLQRRILLLVLLRLEKDFCSLLVLLLDLLLQMLFEFLEIIMLHGALVLQELERMEVDLQNPRQRLPMNLLRTGSPPWAG